MATVGRSKGRTRIDTLPFGRRVVAKQDEAFMTAKEVFGFLRKEGVLRGKSSDGGQCEAGDNLAKDDEGVMEAGPGFCSNATPMPDQPQPADPFSSTEESSDEAGDNLVKGAEGVMEAGPGFCSNATPMPDQPQPADPFSSTEESSDEAGDNLVKGAEGVMEAGPGFCSNATPMPDQPQPADPFSSSFEEGYESEVDSDISLFSFIDSESDWAPDSGDNAFESDFESDSECNASLPLRYDPDIIPDTDNEMSCKEIVKETDESSSDSIVFPMLHGEKSKLAKSDSANESGKRGDATVGKPARGNKSSKSKQHCCKFCQKMNTKMSTHLTRVHRLEPEVAAILQMRKGSSERRKAFIKLQDEGDFKHNYEAIKNKEGSLIPKYQKKEHCTTQNEYVACQYCKALFLRYLLVKHDITCPQKPDTAPKPRRGQCVKQGDMMMPLSSSVSRNFFQKVISNMRDDEISSVIRNDSLILKYGERLFYRRDVEENTPGQIHSRLRELGRLSQLMRKHSNMKVSSLAQAIDPVNFDLLITCTRQLGEFSDSTNMCKKGSLVLKLGYSLKKASQILKAEAVIMDDTALNKKCERFDTLYQSDWFDRVSASASQSVQRARMNKPKLIPSLEDVQKVNSLLQKDNQSDSYGTLAKATLASITIFNRKRGGEVQRMKWSDYHQSRATEAAPPKEMLLGDLTVTEKKLVHVLHRVEIRGKFNRAVPILLTPEMVQSIEKLLVLCRILGIESEYMFMTPTGTHPYRGPEVLKQYALNAGVTDPSLFTATALRKQLATLSQAMEISKLKQDQLASFLGHDIRVHRSVYRQPLDILQKAKVASILFRVNRGLTIDKDGEDLDKEELDPDKEANNVEDADEDAEDFSSNIVEVENAEMSDERMSVCHAPKHTGPTAIVSTASTSEPDLCISKSKTSKQTKTPLQTKTPRQTKRPWSKYEIAAVHRQLSHCITMNRVPQKHDAQKAVASEPDLRRRSWTSVKYYVYNLLKKQRMNQNV